MIHVETPVSCVSYLENVEDEAAPVEGGDARPPVRGHVAAAPGEHLARPRHLEAGVAAAALHRGPRAQVQARVAAHVGETNSFSNSKHFPVYRRFYKNNCGDIDQRIFEMWKENICISCCGCEDEDAEYDHGCLVCPAPWLPADCNT